MIRLLIADDEPVIVSGIQNMFDWEEMGITLAGTCDNGNELWKRLEAHQCDIVISDISMPGKTGLEIIRLIKQNKLAVQVIFISGYSEFSYAQEAVRYGAVDYLTKPIDKDSLRQAVMKAAGGVPQKLDKKELQELLTDYDFTGPADREKANISFAPRQFEEDKEYSFFSLLLVRLDRSDIGSQEYNLFKFSLFARLERYLTGNPILFYKKNYICILLNHEEEQGGKLYQLACDIRDMVREETGETVTILIGSTADNMGGIPKSFQDAVALESYAFFLGGGLVLDRKHIPSQQLEEKFEELSILEKELLQDVLVCRKETLLPHAEKICRLFKTMTYGNPQLAQNYVFALFKSLMQGVVEQVGHKNFPDELRTVDGALNAKIAGVLSFSELTQIIREGLCEIADQIDANQLCMPGEIELVRRYVEENYAGDISLKSMAELVHMNSFYFSGFFKKHTGINFKEYLTNIRMEKAAYLLVSTNLKSYEVAERVGFGNAQHFSSMFREYSGKSPMEYRRDAKK